MCIIENKKRLFFEPLKVGSHVRTDDSRLRGKRLEQTGTRSLKLIQIPDENEEFLDPTLFTGTSYSFKFILEDATEVASG